MIKINRSLSLPENEIRFDFVRSSGPGGQNVNKVSTAVQLRFNVENSPSLPDNVKERLVRIAGKRISDKGILIIDARRYRTQYKNKQDAIERLIALIKKAVEIPKRRKKTKPTENSQQKRLDGKRHRAKIKKSRISAIIEED